MSRTTIQLRSVFSSRRSLLAGALIALLTVDVFAWGQLRSARRSCVTLVKQVEAMEIDKADIESLRGARKLATDRERPNDELIAEIRKAMDTAGIPAQKWKGNEPSQPVRVPKSPYKRLTVRLTFEGLAMHQLVRFVHQLTNDDPAIGIPNLHLSVTDEKNEDAWNVDASLVYLVYCPEQSQGKHDQE